ncbi:hypothetical protein [Neoroseomonas lacus]|uniref:hypothetical protein n=1 Tax=Neoroseomonas lacus TaxID=287609 RepID=UPI00166DDA2A|nr:hypothetical protein [Neoroseomonas lacus]
MLELMQRHPTKIAQPRGRFGAERINGKEVALSRLACIAGAARTARAPRHTHSGIITIA